MTTILLARHGETDWNREGRWQGWADPPLNDLGREQARELADQLRTTPFDAAYASDLRRAHETALVLAAPHGVAREHVTVGAHCRDIALERDTVDAAALGDVDAAERNWDEAERHYTIASKLEPNLALSWLKLGNTRMRKAQPAAAAEAYRKAIERQAELAAAHNGLGAALQAQGDAEGARR